jgi:hypothetical protein
VEDGPISDCGMRLETSRRGAEAGADVVYRGDDAEGGCEIVVTGK